MESFFTEDRMKDFIKCLLSLPDSGVFHLQTVREVYTIKFQGNSFNVQKDIADWLAIPARKENYELLSTRKEDPKLG